MEGMRRKERLDRGIKVRSDTIYALDSWAEMAYLLAPRVLLILLVLGLPPLLPGLYWQRVWSIAATYGLLALGFDFLANYVGLVSLGGALFSGLGAYLAAILHTHFGWSPLVTIPLATLLGGLLSAVLLWPCLPLRGVYFAIATLLYPMLFERIIVAANIFGGTEGLSGLAGLPSRPLEVYLPLVALLLAFFGLRRLVNSDLGLVLQAVKDNDQSVRASGMDVTRLRALAVWIAATVGCFAGAYLAHLYAWAGISSFALDFSVLPIAATVIGGPGTLSGALIGSLLLGPASEALRAFGTLRIVFYALIIILFIAFRSEGLMVYARRKYEQFEHWVEV